MAAATPLHTAPPAPLQPPPLQALEQALEAPLPAELTGRSQGWLSRYRRYPVFSAHWVRGRLRTLGTLVLLLFLGAALPMLDAPRAEWPLGGLLQAVVQLFVPLLLGPWLAWQVRRRGWPAAREWRALLLVMLATIVLLLAFHRWAAEPAKQAVATWAGTLDDDGRRQQVVMQIGIFVSSAKRQEQAQDKTSSPLPGVVVSALLSFFLAGGAGLWGWRRERAGLAALAQERALAQAQGARREAELRLSVLAAQVEPHFLFNTLAGVRSAIATDPARASGMIDRLVEYLRAAIPHLRSDGSADTTLGRQLDLVQSYLALMAARMPRLAWRVDVDPALRALPFPPLMLISLAENAVKHGVEPKVGPAQVEVTARREDDGRLAVTVADDGAGFQQAGDAGGGLGLVNIRERLAQMHGARAALSLRARTGGGVSATITLPVD